LFNDIYAKDYYDLVKKDVETYYKDYQKSLEKRKPYGATYKNEEVPVL